ncbi:hypothetical protein AcW1_002975 [Taiwanofungus camphoratus]|nr:hypothetical protein AcV7_005611 [Antrodia cinnamomea]KAI0942316.1 hypothetical protein AcW1_002975 [Antrodia cinnamomea]
MRLSLSLLSLALPLLALAAPQTFGPGPQCDGGPVECCDATYRADSPEGSAIMKAMKLDARNVTGSTIIAAACGGGGVNVGGGSTW